MFSTYVAKITEKYHEPPKIRTDTRQGGSVPLCDIIDHNLGCNWLETGAL